MGVEISLKWSNGFLLAVHWKRGMIILKNEEAVYTIFYAKIYLVNVLDQKIAGKMEAEGNPLTPMRSEAQLPLAVFRYRTPIIRQWRNTLGVFEDSVEVFPGKDPRQFVSREDIRKAWAYFFCPDHS